MRNEEMDEIKAQNAAMKEQMEQMQKLIEQMMASQQKSVSVSEDEKPVKKSPGRPKKTS